MRWMIGALFLIWSLASGVEVDAKCSKCGKPRKVPQESALIL